MPWNGIRTHDPSAPSALDRAARGLSNFQLIEPTIQEELPSVEKVT
jgi:hypothetical protein